MAIGTIITGAAIVGAGKIKEDSLLGMLYKDTLQPSFQTLGKVLGATIEFSTIPFLYLQQASEKVKANLRNNLSLYEEKLKLISSEDLIQVNPQIGVPILERLTYTTNAEIADLFVSLLAKASSSQEVNQAHPAFIQVISSLTVDEAKIVQGLRKRNYIRWATRMVKTNAWGYLENFHRLTLLAKENSLIFPQNTSVYVDNLIALGILTQPSQTVATVDESVPEWRELLEYNGFFKWEEDNVAAYEGRENIRVSGGVYRTTEFGKSFVKVCS